MKNSYALFDNKGKLKGVADKSMIKYYKDNRDNNIKKVCLNEINIDMDKLKNKQLRIVDVYSMEPLIITNDEEIQLPSIIIDFVFNLTDLIAELDELITFVKDDSYKFTMEEGFQVLNVKMLDLLSSGDFPEGDINIYKLLNEFGGD